MSTCNLPYRIIEISTDYAQKLPGHSTHYLSCSGVATIVVHVYGSRDCGTHLKSSIQDIVDEGAPIKKSPPMGLRADSF